MLIDAITKATRRSQTIGQNTILVVVVVKMFHDKMSFFVQLSMELLPTTIPASVTKFCHFQL